MVGEHVSVITVPEQEHGADLDLVVIQLLPATEGTLSIPYATLYQNWYLVNDTRNLSTYAVQNRSKESFFSIPN